MDTAEDSVVVCTPLPVKPENFEFTLSAYTDGTIHQYPVNCGREPLRGKFFIELNVRASVKKHWTRKRHIGRLTGDGFYDSKAEAQSEVLSHRMRLEGCFDCREGQWFMSALAAESSMPALQGKDYQLPSSSITLDLNTRVIQRGQSKKKPALSPPDEVARNLEFAAAADLRERVSRSALKSREGKQWGNSKRKHASNELRSRERQVRAEEVRVDCEKYVDAAIKKLHAAVKDSNLLVDLLIRRETEMVNAEGDDEGPIVMSVKQSERARLQVLSVMVYLKTVKRLHGMEMDLQGINLLHCATEAAENTGSLVSGRTVANWAREVPTTKLDNHQHHQHLPEFTPFLVLVVFQFQLNGAFFLDKRGDYAHACFVDEEDVIVEAKLWIKGNLKGLTTKIFTRYVNEQLIPLCVDGDVANIAAIMHERYGVKLPVGEETCCHWFQRLGGRYEDRKKIYMVDGHEEHRAARSKYIDEDLGTIEKPSMRELQQPQWIQMTAEKGEAMIAAYAAKSLEGAARLRKTMFSYVGNDLEYADRNGIVDSTVTAAASVAQVHVCFSQF